MNPHELRINAADGMSIACYRWQPQAPPRAILQLAHGMGEHARRYQPVVEQFVAAGLLVYANDHRGHGQTATSPELLGEFGDGGFAALASDMVQLTQVARAAHPDLPVILLGHSMGSFAAQLYILDHSNLIAGVVLSGSAALDQLMGAAQSEGVSSLEQFNAAFEPARTPFDWLSRNPQVVDAYIADPLCGFTATPGSMMSMAGIAARLADPNELRKIRKDLPVEILAGDADPLNANLASLHVLEERYRSAGLSRVTSHYYRDGRHEMLNEINRDEVIRNLLAWIEDLRPRP